MAHLSALLGTFNPEKYLIHAPNLRRVKAKVPQIRNGAASHFVEM